MAYQPPSQASQNQPSSSNTAANNIVTNLGAKTVVAVPEFATIDELTSALVLGRVLQRKGEKVILYFGENNYPLRLQKIIPAGDLKFYQPKAVPNEFMITLKVPRDNKIQRVRWEQNNNELHIFLEPTKEINNNGNLRFTSPARLGTVYLVGTFELRRLENYPYLSEFFQKNTLALHYFNNHKPTFTPENNKGLIDPAAASVADLIETWAINHGVTLEVADRELLAMGKYFNYLLTGAIANNETPKRPGIINNAELSVSEFEQLNHFWQGNNHAWAAKFTDMADFLALIKLTPQLNPLNSNLGTHLKNKPEGRTFSREITFGETKIVISDDLRFNAEGNDKNFSFRRFKDFLIARVGPKESLTTPEQTAMSPLSELPPSELNSLNYENKSKTQKAEATKANLQSPPRVAEPATTEPPPVEPKLVKQTPVEEYVPLRPAS